MAGAGLVGKLKFYLLYLIMVLSAGLAYNYKGGGFYAILNRLPEDTNMFSLLGHGQLEGLLDISSMIGPERFSRFCRAMLCRIPEGMEGSCAPSSYSLFHSDCLRLCDDPSFDVTNPVIGLTAKQFIFTVCKGWCHGRKEISRVVCHAEEET